MNYFALILALLIGYLIGSFAPGYHLVKWRTGKDVRTVESGRTGGTNTFRAAGLKIGLLTGFLDIIKGTVAVLLAQALLATTAGDLLPWLQICAGIGAVIGHNYSIYLGFKGGAGTTPNVGWATAIWWPVFPIGVAVLFGMFYLTGMASVVSLTIGAFLPIVFGVRYMLGIDPTPAYLIGSLITAALVTWALRPNIKRVVEGNERIVGPRAKRIERRNELREM